MHVTPRAVVVAATVGALALVAGCSAETDTRPSGAAATDVPPSLDFEECSAPPLPTGEVLEVGTECATLDVPLDHSRPGGERAEIALLRMPARGGDPIGSLVVNPGGPGQPGKVHALMFALTWAESPVTQHFDIVGFDPRGVGESLPAIDCYSDEERDAEAPFTSFDVQPDHWTEEETAAFAQQCSERSGGDAVLANIGTRDVARDLDLLRAALGDDQLTFAGVSYGTRLGTVYAEMFPQNVRALVLDGAMDPTLDNQEMRVRQFAALQASFEKMASACSRQEDCPLGPDPGRALERFHDLVRPLIDDPVPTGSGRELGYAGAISGVTAALYDEASWPILIDGLRELSAGEGDTLLVLRDQLNARAMDGTTANATEVNVAVNCLDEHRRSPEEELELLHAVNEAAPFLDPGVPIEEARHQCEHWPAQPTLGEPYDVEPDDALPTPLVVSVTGDALTPHSGGIALADALSGSLLTVRGERHGATNVPSPCVQDVVGEYLIDLVVPAEGVTCEVE